MTRLNLLDPRLLTDQHLNAERTEIYMALSSARRSLASRAGLKTSAAYTLGKGHVTFFHDKLGYLRRRFEMLTAEMRDRGMHPKSPWPACEWARADMWNDYRPTIAALSIIRLRIRQRLLLKPTWYRYRGRPINRAWVREHYP